MNDNLCGPLRRNPFAQDLGNGPLPATSTVIAVRWCVMTLGPRTYEEQFRQSIGDVSALDRALHAPLTVAGSPGTVCPAEPPQMTIAVEVLDQDGRLFRPTLPTNACGDPSAVRTALAHTAFVRLPTATAVATRS